MTIYRTENLSGRMDLATLPDGQIDKWHTQKRGNSFYASRRSPTALGRRVNIHMHREIIAVPAGLLVDHINHDGLDNRKRNLRICTQAENLRNRRGLDKSNTSGFRGVIFWKRDNNFRAQLEIGGKFIHLGYYPTAIEASKAHDEAARRYFGEFYSPCKTKGI